MSTSLILPNDKKSLELPDGFDSKEGLDAFEEQVVIAAVDIAQGTVRFSYHIHMILQYELWRHRKTEDGGPAFNTQNEYLEYMSDLCAANGARITGVSTMKAYNTAFKLAKSVGYELPEIEEKGLGVFNEVAQLLVLSKSGEPVRLKYGELPEGYNATGYVREVIDEVGPSDNHEMKLYGSDIKRSLQNKLANKRPIIEFDIPDPSKPEIVTWHVEQYDSEGALVDIPGNHTQISSLMPDYVREAWFRKVGCGWKLGDRE